MKTYATAELDFIDVEALEDGAISSSANREFADTDLFKLQEPVSPMTYATLEHNAFVLDGTITAFPDDTDNLGYAYYSDVISGTDRTFQQPPKITISFSELHSSVGITLYFADAYPEEIRIFWYGSSGMLKEETFYPESLVCFCEGHAEAYNRIEIEILRTAYPQEAVKLYGIKYGTTYVWGASDLVKATVNEEVNPISAEIPINTALLTVHNQDKRFSLANPAGIYKFIQPSQEIHIREHRDDIPVEMGTFYTDTWESNKESQIEFQCVDGIGILDKTDFKDGGIYVDVPVSDIIRSIMESAGWTAYEISDEITDTVSGYLPVCTHREALQQLVFSIGAVADNSRSRNIKIYPQKKTVTTTIGRDRKFFGESKLKLREYVSDVSVNIHQYVKVTEEEELFNGYLYAGINEIIFDGPKEVVSAVGCTIVKAATNYAVVSVAVSGDCTLSGYSYEDKVSDYTAGVEKLPAGQVRNIVSVENATLVSRKNAPDVAKRLLEYYSLRQINDIKYLAGEERSGAWTGIVSQFGEYFAGCLERQSIDLTGGYIAQATVVGYNKQLLAYAYTGEIYTGDGIGVM